MTNPFEGWSQEQIDKFYQECIYNTNKVWADFERDKAWIAGAIEKGLRVAECWLPSKAREDIATEVYIAYRKAERDAEDR